MKRIFAIAMLSILVSIPCLAQGVVITYDSPLESKPFIRVTATCEADGAGAFPVTAFPAKVVELIAGMWLVEIVTIPGTVAPTALYDIELLQTRYAKTYDVCGAALANRSATLAENAVPKIGSFGAVVQNLGDAWSVSIDGNIVPVAETIIEFHFSE